MGGLGGQRVKLRLFLNTRETKEEVPSPLSPGWWYWWGWWPRPSPWSPSLPPDSEPDTWSLSSGGGLVYQESIVNYSSTLYSTKNIVVFLFLNFEVLRGEQK